MNFDDKLEELEFIELPKTYNELLNKIDENIYNCELGLDKALELCIIASIEYAKAEKKYKAGYAMNFIRCKNEKVSVTILKEYIKSLCSNSYNDIIDAELLKQISYYHKIKWEEKLNVYKKIKNTRV